MNRLWVRLTLFVSVVTAFSITLIVVLQIINSNRRYQQLSPAFQASFESIQEGSSLTEAERQERFQDVLVGFLETDEGFRQFEYFISDLRTARRQLTLIAGLIILAFGVTIASLVARFIAAPISQVSEAAKRAATGDLSARAHMPARFERFEKGSEVGNLVKDFNHMASSLERLESERQNMIADIAHELRSPLTIVQGQIDAMQYGVVPLDNEQLAKLSRQTELLARLIKDLRTLSLAEAQRLSLDKSDFDVCALSQDIIDGFQDKAQDKTITLTFAAQQASVMVLLDKDRIAQVIINLLSNALRHTPEGGRVMVRLRANKEEVVIVVADTGEGIPEEDLGRVFDRFYRVDSSRNRATGR